MPADGFRNAFDLAFNADGELFGVDNGPDADYVDELNFIEEGNQSSFVIFGNGAYPGNPLPSYGKYTLTMPPRQVQIAGKVSF